MLQKRIAKLEEAVSRLPARRTNEKPYIATDWTISELLKLVNTCPDYPPDLAKKYSLTNWDHSDEDLEISKESIISRIKRINERGDYIDMDRIVSML